MKKQVPIKLLESNRGNMYEITSAMIKRVSQIIEIKNLERRFKNKKREEDTELFFEEELHGESDDEGKSASTSIKEVLEGIVSYKIEEK